MANIQFLVLCSIVFARFPTRYRQREGAVVLTTRASRAIHRGGVEARAMRRRLAAAGLEPYPRTLSNPLRVSVSAVELAGNGVGRAAGTVIFL